MHVELRSRFCWVRKMLLNACALADSRVHLKRVFSNELGYDVCILMGRAEGLRGVQPTCRVVAGSSFPMGEGVSPSNDAGVTGEEAMSPQHHLPR